MAPRDVLMPYNNDYFLQGAALLAYNDAQFTTNDWDGIRRMCKSVKKKDGLKIGRFGLGFKSIFHMTGMQLS